MKGGPTSKDTEELKELRYDLDLAKELCSEYEGKIETLKEEKQKAVNDVLKSKLKIEEEFRSATLEKQRLKESERILLKTLIEYQEGKYKKPEENPQPKPSAIKCHLCEYKTTSNDRMVDHMKTSHSSAESNGK